MNIKDPLCPATILHRHCLKEFGAEYLNWEPETIRHELPDLPQINYDKIQAVSTILTTQQFYTYWETFEDIVNTLNHIDPHFETFTPTNPIHIYWAVYEADVLDDDEETYSSEIKNYVKVMCIQHGCPWFPEDSRLGKIMDPPDKGDPYYEDLMGYFLTRKSQLE